MTKFFNFSMMALALGLGTQAFAAGNATGNADAKITIKKSLRITTEQDLLFRDAFTGDAGQEVEPNDAEGRNAEFLVTGRAGEVIGIDLPNDGVVVMTTGAGGANETIAVDGFQSNFGGDNATTTLGTGPLTLKVGATHADIAETQVEGDYVGNFSVVVSYQ